MTDLPVPTKCGLVMNNSISKLADLFEKRPISDYIIRHDGGVGWEQVSTEKGMAFIRGLLKLNEIAVVDNMASAGTIYPKHTHDACEVFVVYKGSMRLFWGQKRIEINERDKPYYFDARKEHWAEFIKDTRFIAITKPAEKGWPNGV
jgi:hypothetical protein